jgi:hypothetical protein
MRINHLGDREDTLMLCLRSLQEIISNYTYVRLYSVLIFLFFTHKRYSNNNNNIQYILLHMLYNYLMIYEIVSFFHYSSTSPTSHRLSNCIIFDQQNKLFDLSCAWRFTVRFDFVYIVN